MSQDAKELYKKGFPYLENGDIETAVLYIEPAADMGHVGAMEVMADYYANWFDNDPFSQVTPKNANKAMELSEELAKKDAFRKVRLGMINLYGSLGQPVNFEVGERLCREGFEVWKSETSSVNYVDFLLYCQKLFSHSTKRLNASNLTDKEEIRLLDNANFYSRLIIDYAKDDPSSLPSDHLQTIKAVYCKYLRRLIELEQI